MRLKPVVLRFKFEDFESLPSEPDEFTYAEPVKDCHGNTWQLEIRPGGRSKDNNAEKSMTLFGLYNLGEHNINASFSMVVRDRAGNVYTEFRTGSAKCFKVRGRNGLAPCKFLPRAAILDDASNVLLDGTLIIDVEMQIISEPNEFQPENPFIKNMLNLFEDKDHADVSFKVGNDIIPAHKCVLRANAPMLFSFCDESDDGSPVPITDTTLDVFKIIMRYAYGKAAPEANRINTLGKEIIKAANRYGVVDLTMAVETSLVEQRHFCQDNVVDWLLFADANTCPMLKEYAMAYFSGRVADMLAHETFKKLEASPRLLKELMVVISSDSTNQINVASKLSVDELRKRLSDQGLDVDGSKEVLATRLNESNKRQRTE